MRFDDKDYYPPYYEVVFIEYLHRDRYIVDRAYLILNPEDNNEWILEDTEEIIEDSRVINWTSY